MKKQTVKICLSLYLLIHSGSACAQMKWTNVDSLYQPLPSSLHVYKTTEPLEGKPNIAYYVTADLKDKNLVFDVDTTYGRRLSPTQFYQKNKEPLLVINTTFFSFQTHQNLNLVIDKGKLVAYNIHTLPGKGRDTLTYRHPYGSAWGISKKRRADIAWLYTDSSQKFAYTIPQPHVPKKDSFPYWSYDKAQKEFSERDEKRGVFKNPLKKWKMRTAVGGGPVLLQNGQIKITHNEELKFAGNAIHDKHPRTAMGYTKDQKLILLVVQGRFPGIAEGATLYQVAQILKDLGCWEALNLDGGGSSCMLINGKETIKPSDPTGQRAVPAVFLIHKK